MEEGQRGRCQLLRERHRSQGFHDRLLPGPCWSCTSMALETKSFALFTDAQNLTQPSVGVLSFYNGPTAPAGVFDEFEDIPHIIKNVKSRSFLDLVLSAPANVTTGQRYVMTPLSRDSIRALTSLLLPSVRGSRLLL